ncbi:MAG TPA: M14 family metallopeptidase [Pirellulaceae bacterium]|nr:M14 family metallopeptidase [Pirellulaceae bacterium]HMO91804.1 M14 family metallopeptidase [Pirellulaceae bacterium]HMP69867.1 M14 family metallopeptidase [Pirellulaceae bacterium]
MKPLYLAFAQQRRLRLYFFHVIGPCALAVCHAHWSFSCPVLPVCEYQDGWKAETEKEKADEYADLGLSSPAQVTATSQAMNRRRSSDQPTAFWPDGVAYDTSIPSPKQYFGFDIGERHLRHDQVVAYLQAISAKSERVQLQQYGETHGFRPLLLLTITSETNHRMLPRIKANHKRLADPSESQSVDVSALPAIVNMGYGVHGDEPSATNCAVLVAYFLAAAEGELIEQWLESNVILLDPTLNPDGHDRFANWVNMYRGKQVNADPLHAEHQQSWHRGRTNYYWFDLNRDWLPLVHPESQGRMKWYHEWKPNVVLDFHEMGTNSTFFFQPGIPNAVNPLTPRRNQELTMAIGKYHAKRFDKDKRLYFTQEVFDDYYMGKGSTYPDLQGAIGILFEQASSRGHLQESENGLLSFPFTISNQFSATLSSLEAITDLRSDLLEYKRWYYQTALQDAQAAATRVHMFVANGNSSRLQALATLLKRHDIECYRLKNDMRYHDQYFDSRFSLVVPNDQPQYRFLQTLIERRLEFQTARFYDVSAWTIPLAYGVEHIEIQDALEPEHMEPFPLRANVVDGIDWSDEAVAYLIDWQDDQAPKWLNRALASGLSLRVASRPVTVTWQENTLEFGYGSILIPMGLEANRPNLVRRLINLANRLGLRGTPLSTGLTESVGNDLGSSVFRVMRKPEVAMFVEGRVSSAEAGEIWHALDTRVEMPITLLKSGGQVSLNRYNTLILAGGQHQAASDISNWVQNGGTLIALGSATNFASNLIGQESTIAATGSRSRAPDDASSIQKRFIDYQDEAVVNFISGAIINSKIDITHPLFYGFSRDTLAVFRNHTRNLQASSSPYANPLVYADEGVILAGFVSDQNRTAMQGKPGIVVHRSGNGQIILINDNLCYRGFWLGTQRVLFNAIFFGNLTAPPGQFRDGEDGLND